MSTQPATQQAGAAARLLTTCSYEKASLKWDSPFHTLVYCYLRVQSGPALTHASPSMNRRSGAQRSAGPCCSPMRAAPCIRGVICCPGLTDKLQSHVAH
mmetsp:Transcript_32582/g.77289  ORF Transcript_32582/g.77289 Transcript_32582/m.77289 type:complete len:99 (+) Transcript_32582:114-410(+)